MIEGIDIFKLLGAGGNAAAIAILYFIYKLDRRVLTLEIHVKQQTKDNRNG